LLDSHLEQKKIGATGTIRADRKLFPEELLQKDKLERGEYKYYACNQISVVKWQEKKQSLLQVIHSIQDELKRLLEQKKMVQSYLLLTMKWFQNITNSCVVSIYLINESLVIQLIENLDKSGFEYFFTLFKRFFRMSSSVTMTCVKKI
jgi:hypothetical protein